MSSVRGRGGVALILLATVLMGGVLACQMGKGAAPTVEITFPPTGRQVQVGAVVPVHSVARDDRGLTRVELWSGGQVVETTAASGTTYTAVQQWTAQQVGVVNLGVRAVDSEGQSSEPSVISIQVVASSAEVTDPLPSAPGAPVQTPAGTAQPTSEGGQPTEQEGASPEPGEPVDLELTNLTLSNVNPTPGEEIVVGVTILNRGGTTAQDFHWGWNPGTGEEPIHSESVASLAPGDDVVLEMGYTYQQDGQYSAQAWADSRDAYEEPDETNNFAYELVNVGAVAQDSATADVSFHDYQAGGWATFGVENTGSLALECVHAVVNCGEGAFALHTEDQQARPFLGGWSGRPPEGESLAPGQGAAMAVNIGEMEGPVQCTAEFTFYTQNGGQGMSTGAIPVEFSVEGGGGAQAQQIGASVSFHDYQIDGWATFSVNNGGTLALESMAARISCGEAPNLLHSEAQQNQPFLRGWSDRPPGEQSLAPGQGAGVAVEIGQLVASVPCKAQFTFYSEDNGGGLATERISVEFVAQ
jgi:hypothetical protein